MQIHIEIFFLKILYHFIEMYFLTNENPYGRSLSLRWHTLLYRTYVKFQPKTNVRTVSYVSVEC